MTELTTTEMTEYLKHAMELECSVYKQKEVVSMLQEELELKKPEKPKLKKSLKDAYSFSSEVKKPSIDNCTEGRAPGTILTDTWSMLLRIVGGFCALFFFVVSVTGLYCLSKYGIFPTGTSTIILMVVSILCFIAAGVRSRSVDRKRHQEWKKYSESRERNRERYSRAYSDYLVKVEQEKEAWIKLGEKENEQYKMEYDKALAEYKMIASKYDRASREVSNLSKPLADTKQALEELYSFDVIFSKYRNMAAICTMYEYFVSGRVSELTGPHGAYNLYESEIRSNLIIDKLDRINSNIEIVKQNQYMLYNGIKDTEHAIKDVSGVLTQIENNTRETLEASVITAMCSAVIAQNTEEIKYIDKMRLYLR